MSNVRVTTTFSGYIPGIGQGPINNPITIARRELDRAIAMGYKRHITLHEHKVVEPIAEVEVVAEAPIKPEAIIDLEEKAKTKMIKVNIGGVEKEVTEAEAKALRAKALAKKAAIAAVKK